MVSVFSQVFTMGFELFVFIMLINTIIPFHADELSFSFPQAIMDCKNMKTSDFDYHLPPELIAQTPIEPRDHSHMMVLNRENGSIEHRHFYDIVEYLRKAMSWSLTTVA